MNTRASEPLSADFLAALEAAPTAMLVVGFQGLVLFANRRAVAMFGGESLLGTQVDELVPSDVVDRHAELREGYQAEAPEERAMGAGRDLLARRTDGSLFPVEVGLSPFQRGGQRLTICSVVDISARRALERDQKQAHSAAMESQRLESLGRLAGGVAHDFNNLLVSILGNAKLAQDSPSLTADCLEDIVIASQHAADLARQMLAYSGRGQFQLATLGLSDVVDASQPLLRSLLRRKAELRVHHGDEQVHFEGDAAQLKQILVNLVSNAGDAMAERGGTIRITTSQVAMGAEQLDRFRPGGLPAGAYAQIQVMDTGEGIPADLLEHIFEPFVSGKSKGHGLGLAAVLGIIRGHGGGIHVYSEPGSGTTVKMLFPLAHAAAAEASAAAPSSEPGHVVLVIDDDRLVRRFARRVLSASGFRVLEAEDGQEGVELLASMADEVHVVLLDIHMPRMGGPEAYHEIRRLAPSLPVVLTSGFPKEETMVSFIGHKVAGYLPKPYTADLLLQQVGQALGDDAA